MKCTSPPGRMLTHLLTRKRRETMDNQPPATVVAHPFAGHPVTTMAHARWGLWALWVGIAMLCVCRPAIGQHREPPPRKAHAMTAPASRTLYSRKDLDKLKKLSRPGVFEVLGSFDDRGLSEADFVVRAAELLDPARVGGLAQAPKAKDADEILQAVWVACRKLSPAPDKQSRKPATLAQADQILANRFTFNFETHQLPADINWDHNPGTAHWGMDLNRFTFLRPLTDAYLASGDRRYARKAVELMLDWIAKCDFSKAFVGTPYVFGSYLNNAIHITRWSQCLQALLPGDEVRPIELLRILKSIHDQMAYLEIVTNGHRGNWPTIGCMGIMDALGTFPIYRDTDRFADYCIRTMAAQIRDQVLPDGVQDELTPGYHGVVISNILSCLTNARKLGKDLDPDTLKTLRKMLHYSRQIVTPDGKWLASFNDCDPGNPPRFTRRRLAPLGLDRWLTEDKKLGCELFPYAGVAILRQRPSDGDLYLAFDAGPFGKAHQHEDKLGFVLFAYGRMFLVDPGRHRYDASKASYHKYLVTTTAHSTIKVDGRGQNSRSRPDTWKPAKPMDIRWEIKPGEARASAYYDLGYGGRNEIAVKIAVKHSREIVFVRERFWVVFDLLTGDDERDIESRFQFAPGDLEVDGPKARTTFSDANLLLWSACSAPFTDIHVEKGREDPRAGWFSKRTGHIEPAPALSLSTRAELPVSIATLLFPYKGARPPKVSFAFDGKTATVTIDEAAPVTVRSSLGD